MHRFMGLTLIFPAQSNGSGKHNISIHSLVFTPKFQDVTLGERALDVSSHQNRSLLMIDRVHLYIAHQESNIHLKPLLNQLEHVRDG